MPTGKDTEQLVIVLSKEVKKKLRKFGQIKRWSMSTSGAALIEEGLNRAEREEGLDLGEPDSANKENGKPGQSQPESTNVKESGATPPPRDRSKPRVMSLAELFALKTLSDLIQENYYKLQESGKIGHQRLKKLASGERASQQERQIIAQVLGLEESGLPED